MNEAHRRALVRLLRSAIRTTTPITDTRAWADDLADELDTWLDERFALVPIDPRYADATEGPAGWEDYHPAELVHPEAGVTTTVYGDGHPGDPWLWTADPADLPRFVYVPTWCARLIRRGQAVTARPAGPVRRWARGLARFHPITNHRRTP